MDSEASRQLRDEEVELLRREVPELNDPGTSAWYTYDLDFINDKP